MNNRGFLKRILTAYICIMLIPVAFSFAANRYAIKENNEKFISVLSDSVQNNAEEISSTLSRVAINAQSISLNPEISRMFYDDNRDLTVGEMISFSKNMSSYVFEEELVDEVFLYSSKQKVLVTRQYSYRNALEYFENLYQIKDESPEKTFERISESGLRFSLQRKENGEENYPVIEYIQNVPVGGGSVHGKVVVLLRADKLFGQFDEFVKSSNAQYKVYYNDKLLYSGGKERVKGYTFEIPQKYNNFAYEVTIPKGFVRRENALTTVFLLGMNIMALILGGSVCLYFAMKKIKAYENIILKMELWGTDFNDNSRDEIESIDNFLSELQKSSKEAEQEFIENQRIGDMYGVVHKLLMGFYPDEAEAEKEVTENGVVFNGENYAVMLLSFAKGLNKSMNNTSIENFIKEIVMETIGDMIYIFRVDFRSMAVILSSDRGGADFEAYIENCISLLRVELAYKYNIDLHIGVGREVEKLCEISDSLDEAKKVINYSNLLGDDKISMIKNIPAEETDFEYAEESITDIESNILKGETDDAIKKLEQIKNKVFLENSLPSEKTLIKLREYLERLLVEINNKTGNDSEFILGRKSVPKMFEYVEEYMRTMIPENENNTSRRNDAVHNAIVEYVNKNFTSATISLEELSTHFGLNSSYISTLFRKKTGKTFLRYVEELRIAEACRFIQSKDYKITDIAQMVGYVDYTSFRRNFKKHKGLSPSEYRNNINK